MRKFAVTCSALFLLATNAQAGGTIAGSVRYLGGSPPVTHRPVTVDAAVCGPEAVFESVLLGKRGAVKGALVYLQGRIEGARPFPEPSGGFVLEEKGCRFEPSVLIIAPGKEIQVRDSDGINHSLRTLSRTNPPIRVAQPKGGGPVSLRFDYPEIFEVRCDIHDWEKAWIVVAEHPYYAVTDLDGIFEIRDVPAGDYTMVLWHQALGSETRRVVVRESERLRVDFNARLQTSSFPREPFISQNITRLDVNVLPIRLVK